MEKVKTLVIGAGAVGLAIANRLSANDPDLVLVDKENSFGRHTSSRNSEVIHAGHYYQPGSLKAAFCVKGNALLYDYLSRNNIPYKKTGKIIVATTTHELPSLEEYLNLGRLNGCPDMRLISAAEVCELEPQVKCLAGLYIPSTGIFDTHKYMQYLSDGIEDNGAFIIYGMEVVAVRREAGKYLIEFTNGEIFLCDKVVNSAGLWADKIAEAAGMDILSLGLVQHWCKGEYYKTTKIRGIEHLIYPVADPQGIFLGIHLTLNLGGEVRFGPNAFYVDQIDYRFTEEYLEDFYKAINRYMDIDISDLMPDDTGVRAKLQGLGEGFRDFYIQEESGNGLPGWVNLIGIESPGLTSSLAIADHVASLLG